MMRSSAVLALAALVLGCAASQTADASVGPPPEEQPEALVQMDRTGCANQCPAYQIAVFPDGGVRYQGQSSVRVIGVREKKIPSASLAEIIDRIEKLRFNDLPVHCCDQQSTKDCASVTIAYGVRRARKMLEHYQCCDAAPAALRDLENRIDELVGTAEWTGASKGVAVR